LTSLSRLSQFLSPVVGTYVLTCRLTPNQSGPASFDRLRRWWQQNGNSVPELFLEMRMYFIDGSTLFEDGLVDYDSFHCDGSKPEVVFHDGSRCG